MADITKYLPASDGDGPSPSVFGRIPKEIVTRASPNRGWGFFTQFLFGLETPGWIVTDVANTATITHLDLLGGGILMTPGSTPNDGSEIQTAEAFMPTVGYRLAFGASVAPMDAEQQEVLVGIMTKDTDVCGSPPNDIIALGTVDGATSLLYYCTKGDVGEDGTDTTDDLETATYARLEMFVDELDSVQFYKDGVLLNEVTTLTYINNDEPSSFTIGTQTGESTANTLSIRWGYCFMWKK